MSNAVYDVWENAKGQSEYHGKFDREGLVAFLSWYQPTLSLDEITKFVSEMDDIQPGGSAETLYIRPNWTVEVVKSAPTMSYLEFIQRVYDEYSVYNSWFDELFKNVLDESAHFEDDGDRFNYLDRILPDECPRQWIRRSVL